MSLSINQNIYPNGGYYFKDADGTRHFGDSWAGVIKRVAWYRQRKGVPLGDPAAEVIAQACQRNPSLCTQGRDNVAAAKKQPLKSRVLTWMNNLRGNKDIRFVEDEVRKERSRICASCANNMPLAGGCASCKAALKALRDEVLGRRPFDARLNGCQILGEDLPTSVQIDSQTVEDSELPGHCWRKRR